MYPRPFVPDDFVIPDLRTERFLLQPLGPLHLRLDHEAILATGARLDGRLLPHGWLGDVEAFTLADDIIELAWHERERRTRASFAFIALDHGGTRSLGCAYVYPTDRLGFDAEVVTWGRWDPDDPDLDAHLFDEVRRWVLAAWPFRRPAFPGREIPWDAWLALPATTPTVADAPPHRAGADADPVQEARTGPVLE